MFGYRTPPFNYGRTPSVAIWLPTHRPLRRLVGVWIRSGLHDVSSSSFELAFRDLCSRMGSKLVAVRTTNRESIPAVLAVVAALGLGFASFPLMYRAALSTWITPTVLLVARSVLESSKTKMKRCKNVIPLNSEMSVKFDLKMSLSSLVWSYLYV